MSWIWTGFKALHLSEKYSGKVIVCLQCLHLTRDALQFLLLPSWNPSPAMWLQKGGLDNTGASPPDTRVRPSYLMSH